MNCVKLRVALSFKTFFKLDYEDPNAVEKQITLVLNESKLGKILKRAELSSSSIALYKLYLHDFVHLVYKAYSTDKQAEYRVGVLIVDHKGMQK